MEYRRLSKAIIILFFIILFSILFVSSIVYNYDYYYNLKTYNNYNGIKVIIKNFVAHNFNDYQIEDYKCKNNYSLSLLNYLKYGAMSYIVKSKNNTWDYRIVFSYYQKISYFYFINNKKDPLSLRIMFTIYEDDYSKYYKEVDKELENTISKFSDYLNKQNIEFSFEKKMD